VSKSSVFIIGGGPSLKGFDFLRLRDVDTIVTNVAVFDVPNADYFVTVDYTFLNKVRGRLNAFHRKQVTKIFVANLGHPDLAEANGAFRDIRNNLTYNLCDFDMIIKSYERVGMGTTFYDFRTGDNSGFCALQLAVLLGYTKIYLLGIDLIVGKTDTHYHKIYLDTAQKQFNEKLVQYDKAFRQGIEQLKLQSPDCKVVSCSEISSLNNVIDFKSLESVL
jgi:hypothetical protein